MARSRFRHYVSYWYYKIVRAQGSPQYIARGWGIGMFVGCVVPMSFQLMISIPLSFLLRGSKIGATLGTLITNPVTVIFIYPAQCWAGNKLIGGDLSLKATETALHNLLKEQSWDALMNLGGDLIASFFVGGVLLALIMTPLTYFGVLALVVRYRNFRQRRILQKKQRLAEKVK